MKPRFNIGQRLTVHKSKDTGTVQSLVSSIQGTYVYRLRFPGGAEYSYAEHELVTVQSTYYTGAVTTGQAENSV